MYYSVKWLEVHVSNLLSLTKVSLVLFSFLFAGIFIVSFCQVSYFFHLYIAQETARKQNIKQFNIIYKYNLTQGSRSELFSWPDCHYNRRAWRPHHWALYLSLAISTLHALKNETCFQTYSILKLYVRRQRTRYSLIHILIRPFCV